MTSPSVIALHRVSTDHQDVQRQKARMKKLQEKFGLQYIKTLELVGVSGTDTLKHAQVQQILKDLERPDIDGIAVSELSRLFRPGKRMGQFAIIDNFQDWNKKIWSQEEGYCDPNTDEGYMKIMHAGGQAGAEWRLIRARSRDGKLEKLADGYVDGGVPRYGYKLVPAPDNPKRRHWGIIPEQAQVVLQVYQWRRLRMECYRIASQLNQARIPSQRGGQWSRQTIEQMLDSSAYMGRYVRFGVAVPVPVIVPAELWHEVQEINKTAGVRDTGRPSKHYLLSKLAWCDRCGRRLYGADGRYYCANRTNKPPFTRICQAPSITQDRLEASAWSEIWQLLQDPDLLVQLATEHYREIEKPAETDSLEAEIENFRREITITQRLVQREAMDFDQGAAEIRQMREEIRKREQQIRDVRKVLTLPPPAVAQAAVRALFGSSSRKEPTHFENRRLILEGIQDLRFALDNEMLTIEGAIPVPAPESTTSGEIDKSQKCKRRINDTCTSTLNIPFKINVKVA